MKQIAGIFVGIIIGTAFVYDVFYGKIPNYLTAAGYAGLIPIMHVTHGFSGILTAVMGVAAVGVPLFTVYLLGGIGAGDVKLIGFMGGFLGVKDGLIFTVLVFFSGAFIGIMKILVNTAICVSGKNVPAVCRTKIRFGGAVLIGYLILQISGGGIF